MSTGKDHAKPSTPVKLKNVLAKCLLRQSISWRVIYLTTIKAIINTQIDQSKNRIMSVTPPFSKSTPNIFKIRQNDVYLPRKPILNYDPEALRQI